MRDGVTSDFLRAGPPQITTVEEVESVTDLIARADDDMRSAEEAGNSRGVCMKQTLLRLWNTISAPVDLHELGKIALIIYGLALNCPEESGLRPHLGPSRGQMRIESYSETVRIVSSEKRR